MATIRFPLIGNWRRNSALPEQSPTLETVRTDAQQLLIYAVQTGVAVDPDIVKRIITANQSGHESCTGDELAELMGSIAKLAAQVHPVTADSLVSCHTIARRQIRIYTWVAAILAIFIVPVSAFSFVATGESNAVSTDLKTANDLAIALYSKSDVVSAPAAERATVNQPVANASFSNLQAFAETIRSVKDRSVKLDGFLFFGKGNQAWPPDADIEVHTSAVRDIQPELDRLTGIYQTVRRNAIEIQDEIAMWYGAVATFILPIFYALLGACGYLLRMFSKELASNIFSNRYDISSRFFIALIGGTIIGLFNNFTVPGANLSPLALAFLVGYGADFFFSFLDGILASVKKAA